MHRNTALLIAFLAVLAALVTGLKIGSTFSPQAQLAQVSPLPSSVAVTEASPQVAGAEAPKTYTSSNCGLSFNYDPDFSVTEASATTTLTNAKTGENIYILCGTEFPRPPLSAEQIETATVAGQKATIYHDASAKDGTPLDVVVFSHPKNNLEVALFGFGEVFKKVIQSL